MSVQCGTPRLFHHQISIYFVLVKRSSWWRVKILTPTYRKTLILDAVSLDLLHQVPLVPTANISGITPIYSYTEQYLALITWKKFSGSTVAKYKTVHPDCMQGDDELKMDSTGLRRVRSWRHLCPVQVAIYKVEVQCATLQKLSSTVILRSTRPTDVNRLPLPISLLKMLLDVKRFWKICTWICRTTIAFKIDLSFSELVWRCLWLSKNVVHPILPIL